MAGSPVSDHESHRTVICQCHDPKPKLKMILAGASTSPLPESVTDHVS
jgi:hypothetical protein